MKKLYSNLAASAAKMRFASGLCTGILLLGAAAMFFPSTLFGQYTAGNVVVLQVGDGTSALVNTGNPVLLREFTPTGTAATTVTVPSTGANPLIIGGTATTEGLMLRAANGLSLVFGGYAQALPNAVALSSSTAAAINRTVGSVSSAGVFTRVATSTTFFSGNSIRGVATDGSNNFWASGGNDGTDYFGTASAATNVQNIKTNTRAMGLFNGKLYFSTQSAAGAQTNLGIYQVGTGLPVTSGQAITNIINTGTGTQPSGFFFNAAGTMCYIADQRTIANGGGIQKWNFDGTNWMLAYTLATGAGSTVGAFGVTVDFTGSNPVIYATTTEGTANRVIKITDTGAGSAATTLATATTNTIFRGIALAPAIACPTISATISGAANICVSGDFNFSVAITGGAGPYTVVYSDGTNSFTQNNYTSGATITRNVTQTTTFTLVSVTDAATCTAGTLTGSAVATVSTNPPSIGLVVTDPTCSNNNGAINATITNGTSPFTYTWTTVGGSGLVQGVEDQTGLSAGSYTLVVSDAANCSASQSTTLSIPAGCGSCASASVVSVTNVDCNTPTGSIEFAATGGNPPYQFNIGTGAQTSGLFTGLAPGTYTVTVTDVGNCTQTITATATVQNILDTQAPTFDQNPLPQSQSIACDATVPTAAVLTATDNCNGTVPVVFNQTSTPGSCPQNQTITRTWTATDASGNSTQHTQTISIVDNVKPTLIGTPAATLTIACNTPLPAAATVTATDLCDPTVPVTFNQTSTPGSCPQNQTVTRTWTATDDCGNSTSFVQVISVVDNVPPVFNLPLPANSTISCSTSLPAAPSVTATDNCDPGQTPTVIFINEMHYDNLGADVGEFIEVAGSAGLNLANYALVLYNGNGGVTYDTLELSGTIDNESNGFGAVSFDFPLNGIQNGTPDGIALVTLPNYTVLQFLSYEGPFPATNGPATGQTATDIGVVEDGTNAIGTSVQLTGNGQQSSQFTWVGPITASPGTLNAGQTINTLPATIMATLQQTMMMGTCNGSMIVKRTWTASDACGNTVQHTQTINVIDNSGPTFAPPLPANITLNCTDAVPAPATLIATDACDLGTVMSPWINEIHYDNLGTDAGEFIEIAGPAGTNLANYTLFLYNGSGGGTYPPTIILSGTIPNQSNGYGTVSFPYPVNGLQNGSPDGVALVGNGMVIQFLSYEGVIVGVGGPANNMTSTDIGVFEAGTEPVGQSLRLSGTGNKYSDFVWNSPATATPGTINTGQNFTAAPIAFPVTFSQTQTGPPAGCVYGRTITRTWSVADNCGNQTTHQQIITITDNIAPVLSCPASITANLNLAGQATVTPAQIAFTATDNCSASTALVTLPNSQTYSCANIGASNTFTVSVRDECGNIGTCNVAVNIPTLARCVPKISITDPCVCKNNATTLDNGQFAEVIKIESLTGKVWTVTASNGLWSGLSPSGPFAPIPVIGEKLVENPVGSGDYFLNGIHIDAIGYTVTITSGQGESLTIGNSCSYPNPTITSNLDGPFCLYSTPVPLTGTPGDANIVSQNFTINGAPATVFNPGAGLGTYVIKYTVNGGMPKASGVSDPGCIQEVVKTVKVVATPSQLTCNNHVYFSLDADCSETVLPDDILEGSYACFGDYTVTLTTLAGAPLASNVVTIADIGKTYKATVKHLVTGSVCWGLITIEDKLAPVLTCQDIQITCAVSDFSPTYLKNTLKFNQATPTVTDCSNFTLTFKDTWVDLPCGAGFNGVADLSAYIVRNWTAKDIYNNFSTCTQFIYLKRRHVQDVKYPGDIEVSCTNANTDPDVTGAPYFEDFGLKFTMYPNTAYCELNAIYNDQYLPICGSAYKIIRTWTVYDWCLPTNPGPTGQLNPVYFIQVIKVIDNAGPTFTCPAALTVSTDPNTCCGTIQLPNVLLTDNCSKLTGFFAQVDGTDANTGIPFSYEIPGGFSDFPANNYWNPDTLGIITGKTPCLPLGVVKVTYTAEDACGNTRACTFNMTVADEIPPVAACLEVTQVALGANGQAQVNAATFDKGSYDNCSPVSFGVGRSPGSNSSQVSFSCSDINKTITIYLLVTDAAGNTNQCQIKALVEDKLRPICTSPANVTVSCENFDPSLSIYGKATFVDNCSVKSDVTTANYSLFDTLCNRGTITRTFTVTDEAGLTSSCTQRVFVNYEQDYFVRFPDDKIISVCDGSGNYGEPTFLNKDCELLAVSFTDEIFTVVPDACFKIERTWHIINWCFYNSNLPLTTVPNPNPNATVNAPANLAGPVVSSSSNANVIPAPWTATRVAVTPGAAVTDYSTFWSLNTNGYSYKQIIKIIDTQDPVVENCPASPVTFCDLTPNSGTYWNETYWYDAGTMQHDLCEGPADLNITATDACSDANITFRYLLFLDLDNNGTMETVVSSSNLPGYNNVQFNNANNPNFAGGTPSAFDERLVPSNQKYGFALQITTAGTKKTAAVRWNTLQTPNTYVIPELPYGTHKIKWIVEDGCGNETVCEYTFIVKDCKAPTVVCKNSISVNIMPTGMIAMWASDFLQYTEDNCTPVGKIKIGIRKAGQPDGQGNTTGFPRDAAGNPLTSVVFTCAELGAQEVELWAIDLAGNADFCGTTIIVQDNSGACSNDKATVAGALQTEAGDGLEETAVEISGSAINTQSALTDNSGAYLFNKAVPMSSDVTITPTNDNNPLNGVTTYDLVLISKHILGLEPLNSPYKMICADANKSGSITTFDIVELRKLILGIYTQLPNNTSWRFVDKAFEFPDPINPFKTAFPENISVPNVQSNLLDQDFYALKIGDVNGSAVANSLVNSEDRTGSTLLFDLEDRTVAAGETVEVTFRAAEKTQGFQFTLNLNGLEVAEIVKSDRVSAQNFGVFADALTVSVDGADAFTVRFRAAKSGRLSEMIGVSSRITKAEAYQQKDALTKLGIALRFNGSVIAGVGFELYQNQPNPFVHKTTVGFHLPEATAATLTVFDESGRTLFTLKGDFAKGYNTVPVDLEDADGVLYYRLETARESASKKMVRVK